MTLFVLADMEGISGVCRSAQVLPDSGAPYQEARAFLEADVNACVRGLFAGGAKRVIVRDAHGGGAHMRWPALDPRIELVQGGSAVAERMPGLRDCDGLVLLGYHAMAGTRAAVLEHTMSSRAWQRFWINGVESGEIALDAAAAGDAGVPVLLVTGDDKACAEARRFLPGVVTAQVKQGLDCQYARLLSQPAATARIERAAAEACRGRNARRPYRVRRPVRLRVELVERQPVPAAGNKPYLKVLDGRTYEVSGRTVAEALSRLG